MDNPEGQQLVERIEEVSSELVHVGDYVYSSTTARLEPLCVLVKVPIRSPLQRLVGWQIQLANGTVMWLLRGGVVKRRRFEHARPSAPVRLRATSLTRAA